jgi:hypothetical protein
MESCFGENSEHSGVPGRGLWRFSKGVALPQIDGGLAFFERPRSTDLRCLNEPYRCDPNYVSPHKEAIAKDTVRRIQDRERGAAGGVDFCEATSYQAVGPSLTAQRQRDDHHG